MANNPKLPSAEELLNRLAECPDWNRKRMRADRVKLIEADRLAVVRLARDTDPNLSDEEVLRAITAEGESRRG